MIWKLFRSILRAGQPGEAGSSEMNIADFYDPIMLALAIWRLARHESRDGKRGIAHVILNRINDPRWPHTAADVVTQARQFSAFNIGNPKFPTIHHLPDWAAWQECCSVVDELPTDPDLTHGANHYHSLGVGEEPDWAVPEKQIHVVGALRFYRL